MAKPKLDAVTAAAIDLARLAAQETGGAEAIGEHLGAVAESADRIVTHSFECLLPGYRQWRWSVTLVRASRAKEPTVNEVVLLPTVEALQPPAWVPWADRIGAGDIIPGMLMATPDNDPRLEPGFASTDLPVDADSADWVQLRSTVAELGLGRSRLLSHQGRDEAAQRWLRGAPGPKDEGSIEAPGNCGTCGYFLALRGSLGMLFGACANEFSASDGRVVSLDHGCGGHSDVVAQQRETELPAPVFDTIGVDEAIFD